MHTHNTENTHTPQHRIQIQNTDTTIMQHIEQEREQHTEDNAENNAQPQHTCSAHNYRTYSLDYYNEYAYIKNSNTIELYTILR